MKSKMILACAGLAVCGSTMGQVNMANVQPVALDQITKLRAVTATPILGITADGQYILGEEVTLDGAAENNNRAIQAVYDSLGQGPDTNGDGFFEDVCGIECGGLAGDGFRYLAGDIVANTADDVEITMAAAGAEWDGGASLIDFENCDDIASEPIILSVTLFGSSVKDAVGDGTDGFDNDADGVLDAPYDVTTFLGGAILTFGAGPIPAGFYGLQYDGLIAAGGGFATMPTVDADGNGMPELTIEVSALQAATDTNGDGITDVITFSTDTTFGLWGTPADDNTTCYATNGLDQTGGTTTPTLWGEGINNCGDPLVDTGWSDGGVGADGLSAPAVDFFYDNTVDVAAFDASTLACPTGLHWGNLILADFDGPPMGRLCADVNGDGSADSSDFFAWVNAFGADPRTPAQEVACDVNNDGSCDSSDFFAWVNFFGNPANDPGDCAQLP